MQGEAKPKVLRNDGQDMILRPYSKERSNRWSFFQKSRKMPIVNTNFCDVSMISDKSTDLLVPKRAESKFFYFSPFVYFGSEGAETLDSPPVYPQLPSAISEHGSNGNGTGTVRVNGKNTNSDSKTHEMPKSKFSRQQNPLRKLLDSSGAETIRQNRRLARDEHDWLAAVVERSFFIVFLLMYTFVTVGISAIGFYYWSSVDYITNHYKQ
ncbi:unnamed protein product [Gongylonema pulchrum]|uniref:Neur_chan_memb domain-containing protein n=1 Tax=Gongylonema pulchrum TaxID=637853 RepID=A0A3P7R4R4_9BILA|nr:unnamed protein product [Gongylonema pulchrum]